MTEDKYKIECARQRGVIQAQEKEIARLSRELSQVYERQEAVANDLRKAIKDFILDSIR